MSVTTHVRPVRAVVVATAALMAVLASSLALAVPAAGQEVGSEAAVSTVGLDVELAPSTLYGRDAQVTLRAASTGGDAYNLSFTAALPPGVSYVGGSARVDDRSVDAPRQLAQEDGTTVVVWTNVSDLLSGASAALRFDVRPNTAAYDVGTPSPSRPAPSSTPTLARCPTSTRSPVCRRGTSPARGATTQRRSSPPSI